MANTKAKPEREMETITLFKGKGYEKPVPVWLNGVRYSVPRGKPVKVPAGVADIIKHMEAEKGNEMVYLSREND